MQARRAGRKLVWVAGIAVAGLLVFAGASWRRLATHYHLYRLEEEPSYLWEVLGAPPTSPRHQALVEFSRSPDGARTIVQGFLSDVARSWARSSHSSQSTGASTAFGTPRNLRSLIVGLRAEPEAQGKMKYWYSLSGAQEDLKSTGVRNDEADAPEHASRLYDALTLLRGREVLLPEFPSLVFRVAPIEEAHALQERSDWFAPFVPCTPIGTNPLVCVGTGPDFHPVPGWLRNLAGKSP